ncbi:MAG: hypothetical protein JSR45_12500 [Proteobacteria bacterium]|nr:hypothetical protein [Pseudomonadota bacterium]
MSPAAVLRLASDEEDAAPEEPKVFARVISVPPGMPWDQSRAAGLETRVGAPLPIGEVVYRLRRLEPWAPARAGRFVAFYVRAAEVGEQLVTTVEVEGRPLSVSILSFAEQARRARRLATLALAAGAATVVALGSLSLALSARAKAEERIAGLELQAARKLQQAESVERLKRQARALEAARLHGQSLDDLLKDLAWASTAKAPTSRIEGVHWDHGFMAVEVRGDATPFERLDRPLQKSARPARPGVWLWGVAPGNGAAR